MRHSNKARTGLVAGAALAALALTGIAGANLANAANGTPTPSSSQSTKSTDATGTGRVAEEALTGDAAAKVKAAGEAKYPGATIERMEKDADGGSVYEAHITKADGTHVTVGLDASYTITGEQAGGRGGKGGHHGHGDQNQGTSTTTPSA